MLARRDAMSGKGTVTSNIVLLVLKRKLLIFHHQKQCSLQAFGRKVSLSSGIRENLKS